MYLSRLVAFCLIVLGFSNCERDSIDVDKTMSGNDRASRTGVCAGFSYADSVFYIRNQVGDYVVSPVTAQAGTYSASPWGLVIDPSTGAINISKSETGLTYKVAFVKTGSADTCTRDITIAGIDIASTLYTLGQGSVAINPTYKGAATGMSLWTFDVSGTSNNLPLKNLGVATSQQTAAINLKQTVSSGTFGSVPVSGTSKMIRMYYIANDASKKALNHIDVRLSYYDSVSDVPASLLSKVKSQNARIAATSSSASAESTGARPPEIVIVGH